MELSEKQILFCDHYLKKRNLYQAAEAAGIQLKEELQPGYYVYFLIEKELGRIFYVGKGKCKRARTHFQVYRVENVFKSQEIDDIIIRGHTATYVIFEGNLAETEAFSIERQLIDILKPAGLTNEIDGCTSAIEKGLLETRRILNSIIPFQDWLTMKPRSKASISNYRFIVNQLNGLLSMNA